MSIRETLITRFVCSECGGRLKICYAEEATKEAVRQQIWEARDDTGAAVYYNKIMITPCSGCISKLTEPARQLSRSIKALAEIKE